MTTRSFSYLFGFLALLLLMTSCGVKSKRLDTPEGTYQEALRLIDAGFYEEARTQLYRIKTDFPSSNLQVSADLKVADSYFEEQSWKAAATSYEEFIRTYPGQSEVPYALYKMGMSYLRQMPSHPQRDSRSTEQVLNIFSRLLAEYPESEYSQEAAPYIKRAQNQLAEKAFSIARFYEKQKNYKAAAARYEKVFETYPDLPRGEEALARQVLSLRKAGETERAEVTQKRFLETFPNSSFGSMIQP